MSTYSTYLKKALRVIIIALAAIAVSSWFYAIVMLIQNADNIVWD